MNHFIIFEGLDNVGKDTRIKLIIKDLCNNNVKCSNHILHYSALKMETPHLSKLFSYTQYMDMFRIMQTFDERSMNFIFNRSHIGEAVYAPMYRGYDGDYIFDIEKMFVNFDFWEKIYLIVLMSTPEELISRDDGKSFSIDKDKKQEEINKFTAAYNKSLIEHKILINIEGKNIDNVHKEIKKFLGLS